MGHEVSYDWTTHKPIKPYVENQDYAKEYSENELEGIANSDVFIYLTEKDKGTTLPMEFGSAIMPFKLNSKPIVYAVGFHNDLSPWFFNKYVNRRNTLGEVLDLLGPADTLSQ